MRRSFTSFATTTRALARVSLRFQSLKSNYAARACSSTTVAPSARPGIHQSPIVDRLWAARAAPPPKATAPLAVSVDGLVSWPASHSHMAVEYAFSADALLRDRCVLSLDAQLSWLDGCQGVLQIRMGKILEDLDALAGSIALEHCRGADGSLPPPYVAIVTASVDRIVLRREYESIDVDMKLTGSVTYTGSSSMEVRMSAMCEGFPAPFAVASFTFVARDTRATPAHPNGTSWRVNTLVPVTDEEKQLHAAAAERMAARKRMKPSFALANEDREIAGIIAGLLSQSSSLSRMPCLPSLRAGGPAVLTSATRLSNSLICQPQQRNTAGRVFGGFLMRRAFELAFATAYVFCGRLPTFIEVDEVTFRQPVEVGNLLQFDSCVLFTSANEEFKTITRRASDDGLIFVEVTAHVTVPEKATANLSNSFYFTFSVASQSSGSSSNSSSSVLPTILPDSTEQAHRMVGRMMAEALQNSC